MKHMKKLALLGAILLTLVLGSCDALFSNKFQEAGLGQTSETKIQAASAETLIDDSGILSGQLSDTFFKLLKDNPDLSDETLTKLEEKFASAKPEIAQAAITLAIQIQLNKVSADEVVANAPAAIALLLDKDLDLNNSKDLQDFLNALLPAEITGKAKAFNDAQLDAIEKMINQLVGLKSYFTTLAANIKDNGIAAQGMDVRTLTQVFLLVKILNEVTPVGATTLGASIRAILVHINNGEVYTPSTYINLGSLGKSDGFEALLEDPELKVLLKESGLDISKLFGNS